MFHEPKANIAGGGNEEDAVLFYEQKSKSIYCREKEGRKEKIYYCFVHKMQKANITERRKERDKVLFSSVNAKSQYCRKKTGRKETLYCFMNKL